MSTVLPIGYVTMLEAAEMLQVAMHAGLPDTARMAELRRRGLEVSDGPARDRAIAELWKAVDKHILRSMAIGGSPRRIVRLDAYFTRSVPTLRSPRGRGLTFLRPSNPAFHELGRVFGGSFHDATLIFRATDVQKLGRRLMRARRTARKADGHTKGRGRPSIIGPVQSVIRDVINRRKWDATMSMKALTREVNRGGRWPKPISQDSVMRAIDGLFQETGERQFQRIHRPRRPRSSGFDQQA
jgi:hypothetical protein